MKLFPLVAKSFAMSCSSYQVIKKYYETVDEARMEKFD